MKTTQERLEYLKNMKDSDIDLSDIPELTEEDFKRAKPCHLQQNIIHIDQDILDAFKSSNPVNYENEINAILRQAVMG